VPQDPVGERVRGHLTPRQMRIAALLIQGHKNKEIGLRLGTTEQAIKNELRNIYDKSGASDRLELALFILHHRTLAEAAESVGRQFETMSSVGTRAYQTNSMTMPPRSLRCLHDRSKRIT
jgi:DNA-binding CsgD family transcriptional regulator